MQTALFMCAPEHFGIEYEINPWMSLERQPDRGRAKTQWESLYRFLTCDLDVDVKLIAPVANLPDMVFTANAGLALDKKFVSSRFRHKERRGESEHYEAWFKQRGYSVHTLPGRLYFEGEGDVLFAGEADAYAGYLIRSDVYSHAAVADLLGARIVSLELVDPRFYHLDTCFCPLSSESVVYYPEAFDSYARDVIKANFPDRIEVTEQEALQFVCNAIIIGNHYIQPRGGSENLRPALEARGYKTHEFDMSEFIKAGGATKCLVLKLMETTKSTRGYK
ncbi:amidinotransferase [Candidatus Poribacteria bacterium]|nr:amidinotransferase [Candidatus Poribacteria bacterium]